MKRRQKERRGGEKKCGMQSWREGYRWKRERERVVKRKWWTQEWETSVKRMEKA